MIFLLGNNSIRNSSNWNWMIWIYFHDENMAIAEMLIGAHHKYIHMNMCMYIYNITLIQIFLKAKGQCERAPFLWQKVSLTGFELRSLSTNSYAFTSELLLLLQLKWIWCEEVALSCSWPLIWIEGGISWHPVKTYKSNQSIIYLFTKDKA